MAKIRVCGIEVPAHGEKTYGGGNIFPGAREIGRYAFVSKATAQKLLKTLFGHTKLPKAGWEIKLCDDQFLTTRRSRYDRSLPYEVDRRASGSFAGTKHRRRKQRRR